MMIRRFLSWPPSLATQLIGLVLAAIVFSQLFALWLFTDERRLALLSLAAGTVVARTSALVELLDNSPPGLRDQIAMTASSPLLYYWISEKPQLEQSGDEPVTGRIYNSLKRELGAERDIRIDVGRNITVPRYHPPRRHPERHPPPLRPRDRPPGAPLPGSDRRTVPLIVAMSVRLADGNWLNMAGNLNLPAIPLWRTIFVSGIMAIAVIIVIGFTVRRLTKPLRRLASAADSLGRGESVGKVDSSGPPEIRSAIGAFNTMQERLTRFIRDRTAMLAAVSHDLRTPITSLRIRAEFIEDEENRTRVIAALDEMQRMVEATLAFARDEAHREQPARVDLGEFLDAIVTDYQDVGKAVRFASEDKPGRIVISFSPIAIRRALRNLIDNALRYGNEANIDYRQVAGQVEITVSDTGPGIPEARLADMFEPFVRLEGSRSGDTGGIGLGLAIARSAIHAHGGTISLENRSEGGLVARVTLPR